MIRTAMRAVLSCGAAALVLGPVPAGAMQPLSKSVSAPAQMARVANNATLAGLSPVTGRVRREGFAVTGDGGAADFDTTATPCPIGAGAGDGGSQVGLVGPSGAYVGCAHADLGGQRAVSVNLWGAREDSNGLAGTGTDSTSAMKAALAWSQASGRQIFIPSGTTGKNGPGMVRVTAPLAITGHVFVAGDYCEHDNGGYVGPKTNGSPSPGPGSYLYFDHAGKGITVGTAGAAGTDGVVLDDFCLWRNQPAPPAGSDGNGAGAYWAPASNDYDIYEASDDLRLEHLMFMNPTNGIEVAGGRLTTYDVRGQFLSSFYRGDGPADVNRIMNTHAYPFWSQNSAVLNYMRANQVLLYTGRDDGFRIKELYADVGGTCWHVATNDTHFTTMGAVVDTLSCDDFGLGGITTDGNPSTAGGSGVSEIELHSYAFGGAVGTYTTASGGTSSFRPGPALNDTNGMKVNAFGFSAANTFGSPIVASGGAVVAIYGVPQLGGINRSDAVGNPILRVDATSYVYLFGSLIAILPPVPANLSYYSATGTILLNGFDPRVPNGLIGAPGVNCAATTLSVPARGHAALPTPSGGSVLLTDQANGQAAFWTLGGSAISQPVTANIATSAAKAGFLTGPPSGPNQVGLLYDPAAGRYMVYNSYLTARSFSVCQQVGRNAN